MERFWSGQALGRQPVGAADLLISGHWHHLRVQQLGEAHLDSAAGLSLDPPASAL